MNHIKSSLYNNYMNHHQHAPKFENTKTKAISS